MWFYIFLLKHKFLEIIWTFSFKYLFTTGFLDFGHFLIVQIKSPVGPQGSFYNNITTCCYEDSDNLMECMFLSMKSTSSLVTLNSAETFNGAIYSLCI